MIPVPAPEALCRSSGWCYTWPTSAAGKAAAGGADAAERYAGGGAEDTGTGTWAGAVNVSVLNAVKPRLR